MSEKMTIEQLLDEYQQLPEFHGTLLTSVNQQGGFFSTPLHIAIYRERPEEVKLLLESKADPNAAGEYGERPLQVAVNCCNKEIIEQLLRAGARPELKDDRSRDAWQVAKAVGFHQELQKAVEKMGAEPKRRDLDS